MIDKSKWYVCYRGDTTPITWINGKAISFPSEEVAKRFICGLSWKGLVPYKAEIYWIFGNIKFEDIPSYQLDAEAPEFWTRYNNYIDIPEDEEEDYDYDNDDDYL